MASALLSMSPSSSSKDEEHSFVYPSLSVGGSQIRLLTVDLVDETGTIHCSLAAASLDRTSKYVALSYVWGEDEVTQKIIVNGSIFRIRSNRMDFFNTVAAKKLLGVQLFVDAICINQSDMRERCAQVALMKRIYGEAERVIAWLCSAHDMFSHHPFTDASRVVAVAKDIEQETKALVQNFDDIERVFRLLNDGTLEDPRKRKQMLEKFRDLERRCGYVQYAILQFSYRRTYWERVWIIQEIILANALTIQVGEHSIDSESYWAGVLQDMESSQLNIDAMVLLGQSASHNFIRRETRIYDLVSRRTEWQERLSNGPPIKLYEVLIRFSQQQSSEPLDYIFGFLGLAESHVKPDYTLTSIELYTYVLIEGIRELHDVPVIRQELNAPWTFYHACLSAFQFSASDPAIALISNKALSLCGIPLRLRFLVLMHGIFASDVHVLRVDDIQETRGSPRLAMPKMVAWTLYATVCASMSCIWLVLRIRYLRIRNAQVAGPAGDVRSHAEWTVFVENTALLVRKGLPPRSVLPSDDNDTDERNPLDSLPTIVNVTIVITLKILFYLIIKPFSRLTGRSEEEVTHRVLIVIIRFVLRLLRFILRPWFWAQRFWAKLRDRQVVGLR